MFIKETKERELNSSLKYQQLPTPVFLPGESQGWEPGGLLSIGSHRVGHDWCDLAAAAAYCLREHLSFLAIWGGKATLLFRNCPKII